MYQICISGAARGKSVAEGALLAYTVGREVARRGHAVFTGATVGLPYEAAKGAKKEKGQSVGISPAATLYEHVKKYRLPIDAFDVIFYTGLNYVGRDLLLVQSSDAVISVGGRIGTWHEFTVAMETEKPIAVLEGAGGVGTEFRRFLQAAGKRNPHVIFETDPKVLVDRLLEVIDLKYADREISKYLHKGE